MRAYSSMSSLDDSREAMRAYAIVERLFMAQVYALVKCRFEQVLRHLSLPALQGLSRGIARSLYACGRPVRRETRRVLAASFPHLGLAERDTLAIDHLSCVVLNMLLFPAMTAMSDARIDAILDCSELDQALAARRGRFAIFVGAHFYSHVTVGLFSEMLYRRREKLCMSFQLKEDEHVAEFLARAKARVHWDAHHLVNVASSGAAGPAGLGRYVEEGDGSVFIMGDFRLVPRRTDMPFRVGEGLFHSNAGFRFVVERAPESALVIPCHVLVEGEGLKLKCGAPLEKKEAVRAYYERVLPEQIASHPAQWQLWYLAGALLARAA
jgi:lauroyl/myristoyl acyltransferase